MSMCARAFLLLLDTYIYNNSNNDNYIYNDCMLLYICDYIVGADIMVNRIHIIDILPLLYPLMILNDVFLLFFG